MSDDKQKFINLFLEKIESGSFVKATLGKKRGGDEQLKNIYVTPVNLKAGINLSFLYRYKTRDEVKNFSATEAAEVINSLVGVEFLSCHLFSTDRNVELSYSRKLKSKLHFSKASFQTVGSTDHNKKKNRFVSAENNQYLQLLGVVSSSGQISKKKEKKFRQIDKFIEIIDGIIRSSDLMGREKITVVDMGAGKGYLTFALFDYLKNTLKIEADIVGVEARQDVVDKCNKIAGQVGFAGLSFVKGYISDYEFESADLLIALHACDTATDDSIYKGVLAKSEVIVCAPCCHKEISPQISCENSNSELMGFGILKERQAAIVTDGLRALLLKSQGYKTNVFEFISSEHTAKNIMISAVKSKSPVDVDSINAEIESIKSLWGVKKHHLQSLLD